jgi:hypothetical protein
VMIAPVLKLRTMQLYMIVFICPVLLVARGGAGGLGA